MAKTALLLSMSLALGGCGLTRPLFLAGDLREKATQAADDYSTNLRWGRLSEAAKFVEPLRRPEFLAFFADGHDYRNADTTLDGVEYDDVALEATATVRFTLYTMPRVREIRLVDSQRWRYDREGDAWYIDPDLEAFRMLIR